MSDLEIVNSLNSMKTQERYSERKGYIEKKAKEIPRQYEGDIRRYKEYCESTEQIVGTEAMLDYLYVSLTKQKIKKTTWERRLAAIRKYLNMIHRIEFKGEARVAYELSAMRKIYREDQYAHLLQVRGKSAIDKKELMETLNSFLQERKRFV